MILDKKTAALVGLERFPLIGRKSLYFPETATRLVTPIHRAPLTLPGVAFIETDIRVARNVLVQPTIFLPFYDIGFEKRFIKFKQKTEGYDVPYISKGPQPFNLGGVNYPSNIDSGSVGYSLLPEELVDKINIRKYPRMLAQMTQMNANMIIIIMYQHLSQERMSILL